MEPSFSLRLQRKQRKIKRIKPIIHCPEWISAPGTTSRASYITHNRCSSGIFKLSVTASVLNGTAASTRNLYDFISLIIKQKIKNKKQVGIRLNPESAWVNPKWGPSLLLRLDYTVMTGQRSFYGYNSLSTC